MPTWRPEGQARAAIVAVHGANDHSDGLVNIRAHLVAQGYAVHALDLRGHGRSPGSRDGVRKWEEYTEDLHALVARVRLQEAGCPLFLLGHSLGGSIVLDYALQRPDGLAGVVAITPAFGFKMSPVVRIMLRRPLPRPRFPFPAATVMQTGTLDPFSPAALCHPYFEAAGTEAKELREYEALHRPFGDLDRAGVLADLSDWLERQVLRAGASA